MTSQHFKIYFVVKNTDLMTRYSKNRRKGSMVGSQLLMPH